MLRLGVYKLCKCLCVCKRQAIPPSPGVLYVPAKVAPELDFFLHSHVLIMSPEEVDSLEGSSGGSPVGGAVEGGSGVSPQQEIFHR